MKILIVDEHTAMREMIRSFLPESFDEIRECADGADALESYRSFRPDWVIIEWELKRSNGLVITRKILADFQEASILLITQHNDSELRVAATEAGAKGFVLKDNLPALRSLLLPS